MSSIQRYLQNANRSINEQFIGVDGVWENFTDDTDIAQFYRADGDGMSAPSPMRSQPYIVTVSNASNAAVTVDLFGAYIYLNSTGFTGNNGSLVLNSTTISSGLSNTTYYNLLNQSSVSPFTIGSTLINSINGVENQVLNSITLTTQDANGNQAVKVLTPTIDPYQNQKGVIELKQAFRIDGFTKLTLNVFALSSVQFQFYPADNINIARGLAGSPVSKQYGNPQIIRPAVR